MKPLSIPQLSRARRKGILSFIVLALSFALLLVGCGSKRSGQPPAAQVELTLSAAASLADVLNQVIPAYQKAHAGVTVHVNLGSSGVLANQIAQGAPVDVFISAGQDQVDRLVQGGQVDAAQVHAFVSNRLVLIVPAQGPQTVKAWADLASSQVRHVAIGNPAHVPAGKYAQATLQSLKLWDAVQPRLVLGEDVRQALQFVESGEADAGLVYATDAATSNKVKVVDKAPAGSHPPIDYPIAMITASAHPRSAQALVDYLLGSQTAGVLRAAGFEVNR